MPHETKHLQKRRRTKSKNLDNFVEKAKKPSHATVPVNLAFPDHLVLHFLIFLNQANGPRKSLHIPDRLIYLDLRASLSWSADWALTCRRGGLCASDGPALQHPHQQSRPGPPSSQGMLTNAVYRKRGGGGKRRSKNSLQLSCCVVRCVFIH